MSYIFLKNLRNMTSVMKLGAVVCCILSSMLVSGQYDRITYTHSHFMAGNYNILHDQLDGIIHAGTVFDKSDYTHEHVSLKRTDALGHIVYDKVIKPPYPQLGGVFASSRCIDLIRIDGSTNVAVCYVLHPYNTYARYEIRMIKFSNSGTILLDKSYYNSTNHTVPTAAYFDNISNSIVISSISWYGTYNLPLNQSDEQIVISKFDLNLNHLNSAYMNLSSYGVDNEFITAIDRFQNDYQFVGSSYNSITSRNQVLIGKVPSTLSGNPVLRSVNVSPYCYAADFIRITDAFGNPTPQIVIGYNNLSNHTFGFIKGEFLASGFNVLNATKANLNMLTAGGRQIIDMERPFDLATNSYPPGNFLTAFVDLVEPIGGVSIPQMSPSPCMYNLTVGILGANYYTNTIQSSTEAGFYPTLKGTTNTNQVQFQDLGLKDEFKFQDVGFNIFNYNILSSLKGMGGGGAPAYSLYNNIDFVALDNNLVDWCQQYIQLNIGTDWESCGSVTDPLSFTNLAVSTSSFISFPNPYSLNYSSSAVLSEIAESEAEISCATTGYHRGIADNKDQDQVTHQDHEIHLCLFADQNEEFELYLYTLSGQHIDLPKSRFMVTAGKNNISIPINTDLSSGIYILEYTKNGKRYYKKLNI